jgi:serine/threonine protein kinase
MLQVPRTFDASSFLSSIGNSAIFRNASRTDVQSGSAHASTDPAQVEPGAKRSLKYFTSERARFLQRRGVAPVTPGAPKKRTIPRPMMTWTQIEPKLHSAMIMGAWNGFTDGKSAQETRDEVVQALDAYVDSKPFLARHLKTRAHLHIKVTADAGLFDSGHDGAALFRSCGTALGGDVIRDRHGHFFQEIPEISATVRQRILAEQHVDYAGTPTLGEGSFARVQLYDWLDDDVPRLVAAKIPKSAQLHRAEIAAKKDTPQPTTLSDEGAGLLRRYGTETPVPEAVKTYFRPTTSSPSIASVPSDGLHGPIPFDLSSTASTSGDNLMPPLFARPRGPARDDATDESDTGSRAPSENLTDSSDATDISNDGRLAKVRALQSYSEVIGEYRRYDALPHSGHFPTPLGFARLNGSAYLFTELHMLGDLHKAIATLAPHLSPEERSILTRTLCKQVLEAIAQLHAQGTYHQDIKPKNLLLSSTGLVVVSDYGFASNDKKGITGGTPRYQPLEARHKSLAHLANKEDADKYAVGCTLKYIAYLLNPHDAENFMDADLKKVVDDLTSIVPGDRPELTHALSQAYFSGPTYSPASVAGLVKRPATAGTVPQ